MVVCTQESTILPTCPAPSRMGHKVSGLQQCRQVQATDGALHRPKFKNASPEITLAITLVSENYRITAGDIPVID